MLILWVSGSYGQVYGFEYTLRHDIQPPWVSDLNRLDTFVIHSSVGLCCFIDLIESGNFQFQEEFVKNANTFFWIHIILKNIIRNSQKKFGNYAFLLNATGKILHTTEEKR